MGKVRTSVTGRRRFSSKKLIRLGQFAGMVCAFVYAVAAAVPLVLAAAPGSTLSWVLYFDLGKSFSVTRLIGPVNGLAHWLWVSAFVLSLLGCFMDIRSGRFRTSGVVLAFLFVVTVAFMFEVIWMKIYYSAPIELISGWIKLALLVFYGNFLYLGAREIVRISTGWRGRPRGKVARGLSGPRAKSS